MSFFIVIIFYSPLINSIFHFWKSIDYPPGRHH